MEEYKSFTAKTVDDAITAACEFFLVTSDHLDYEVVNEGSSGFLGINAKPAVINARVKEEVKEEKTEKAAAPVAEKVEKAAPVSEPKATKKAANVDAKAVEEAAKVFCKDVFGAMGMEVTVNADYNESNRELNVDFSGAEMGMLIGKRGQTLDSLQYLISLVVNKSTSEYIRVKVDTENYRERRKETLENLARNIAIKVKKTRRAVSLEPMNPYERRIIHSALQNDKYVTTHSEGEEPFRHVVVTLIK